MVNKVNSKKYAVLRRVIAVMLILTLMAFVGCKESGVSSDPQYSNSSQNNSSNNASVPTVEADRLAGEVSSNPQYSNSSQNNSSNDASVPTVEADRLAGEVSSNPQYSNSSQNNSSNDASVPTVEADRLAGEVSYNYEVETELERDDADEILPNVGDAFKENALTGYYEAEANALRQKILNTGNTEEYYEITGTKYYISPGGDDDNSGTSPEEALRTPEGLMNVALEWGDAVLFERDSVFRITSSILTTKGVIYGSYGEGDKPKIYASAENYAEVEWEPSNRKNIWEILYIHDNAGCVVFNHGEEVGVLKTSVRQLSENGQFYHDEGNNMLYIYCDKGNPASVYDSIEVCAGINMFYIPTGSGDVVIDNLCLMYCSGFGVRGYYNNYNITVTNCEMGYMGGYRWHGTRMGNAIQLWQGADGFVVKNNWIYQTFDTAITWQGQGGAESSYNDIYFVGNLLEYNHTDFEFWDHGTYGEGHATVSNFVISNNISRFNTLGWGSRENDGGLRGFEGFIDAYTDVSSLDYDEAQVVDKIVVKNNIVDCPGNVIVNWEITPSEWATKYDVSGNKVYINSKLRQSTTILRGFQKTSSDELYQYATNLDELITAITRFDTTVGTIWD